MLNRLMFTLMTCFLTSCSGLQESDIQIDTPKDLATIREERYGKMFGDIEFYFSDEHANAKSKQQNNTKEEEFKK